MGVEKVKKETPNQIAVRIAKLFYEKTNRRCTSFTIAIGQAKNLLKAGFSEEEITLGIDYFIEHPPRNGFNSLGWLSYGLEDALKKLKAKEVMKEFETAISNDNVIEDSKSTIQNAKTSTERVDKDFDFNIFGGG